MEITIDTAMRNLSMYDIDECGNAKLHTWYNGIDSDMRESFTVAIDTMHKYQEIRKIYMTHHYTDEEVIEKIKEVIKWG